MRSPIDTASRSDSGTRAESSQQLLGALRERGVGGVIVAGADPHGLMRGKRVAIEELPRLIAEGMPICEVIFALPVDEAEPVRPPAGHRGWFPRDGYPDILAMPDPASVRVLPWEPRSAIALSDFSLPGGAPLPVCPRRALRGVVERASRIGLEPLIGIEIELYLLRESADSVAAKRPVQLVPLSPGQRVYGVREGAGLDAVIRDSLRELGLAVESCHPEGGPGQFEIALAPAPALEAADQALLLRGAVKELAAREGLLATFMSRPRSDWFTSSLHLHASLLRDGEPAFCDPAQPHGISETMRRFAAGLLAHTGELSALMAPNPNSYRRFTPHSWAATTASWSVDNRTAGVRVLGERPAEIRLEQRRPGADANPYLAIAATLAAGLRGIEERYEPPELVEGDLYALPEGTVPGLPATLGEAVLAMEAGELAREWLGADLVSLLAVLQRAELEAQAAAVTDWETARYLEAL